jgi:flavin reductase (DIM6/NTAB) family NADH-FMN oxidoreductase RutF
LELVECFKEIMRDFPTGVTVVTSTWRGKPAGMTVNTFNSLSLNPPLVAFFADVTRGNHLPFVESSSFAVNFVDSPELLNSFAFRPLEERFKGVEYRIGSGGSPILAQAYAYLESSRERVMEVGDHVVIVGRVEAGARVRDPQPLVYYRRAYWRLCPLQP